MNRIKGWLNQNNRLGWDDERFPMTGSRAYTAAGRLAYNYFNGGIDFQSNALYPTDPVSITGQMPHSWLEGSEIRPHIHWLQTSSAAPNWLFGYKIANNGSVGVKDTDFSNHTFSVVNRDVFTYTSGALIQISSFPAIDMTGINISAPLHFVIFRDTTNVSGLFAGADPSATDEFIKEFDFHWQRDSYGSWEENSK